MSKAYFVTSSGTDIGKTFVTALLCRALLSAGKQPGALKPIMSGFADDALEASDAGQLLAALGVPVTLETVASISPWRFEPAISPDMAAKRVGQQIILDDLVRFCRLGLEAPCDALFIEAAGGLMAPINENQLMLDWAEALGLPLLLVVGSYLGTISHTLTAVEAAKSRDLPVHAILISESESNPVPLAETQEAIQRYVQDSPVLTIERGAAEQSVAHVLEMLT